MCARAHGCDVQAGYPCARLGTDGVAVTTEARRSIWDTWTYAPGEEHTTQMASFRLVHAYTRSVACVLMHVTTAISNLAVVSRTFAAVLRLRKVWFAKQSCCRVGLGFIARALHSTLELRLFQCARVKNSQCSAVCMCVLGRAQSLDSKLMPVLDRYERRCTLGFDVMGIFQDGMDGTDINSSNLVC